MNRVAAGFTLVEVLMAIFVSSLIFGGLAAISGAAARTQGREYRHGLVGINVLFALRTIEINLASASGIVQPAVGGSGNALCAQFCTNCGGGASAYITPTYRYVFFCRTTVSPPDPEANKLYMHKYDGDCPAPSPCGSDFSPTGVADFISELKFSRSAVFSNSVQVAVTGSLDSPASGTVEIVSSTGTLTMLPTVGRP